MVNLKIIQQRAYQFNRDSPNTRFRPLNLQMRLEFPSSGSTRLSAPLECEEQDTGVRSWRRHTSRCEYSGTSGCTEISEGTSAPFVIYIDRNHSADCFLLILLTVTPMSLCRACTILIRHGLFWGRGQLYFLSLQTAFSIQTWNLACIFLLLIMWQYYYICFDICKFFKDIYGPVASIYLHS